MYFHQKWFRLCAGRSPIVSDDCGGDGNFEWAQIAESLNWASVCASE